MLTKIKSKFQGKDIKRVLKNMFSLFILQGSNYILPLILLPYLIRVLGVEYFGLLAFATATINMLRGFVSYGFDLSGTQLISRNRDDNLKITEVFSSILVVKLILSFISFLLLCLLLIFVDKFQENWEIFMLTFLLVFGDVLFPIWFFQGMEKMKIITYIRIVYKSIFVISIIFLVNSSADIWIVPLIDAIGAIIAGGFALYLIKKDFNIVFKLPSYSQVIFQFRNGWHIFVSKIAVILYTSLNTFVLGILTNNESVGYYSIAEKIYMAIRGLFTPIVQALFPFLSKKYLDDKTQYYKIIKKISISYFLILILLTFVVNIFSIDIINLITGKVVIESVEVLKILSLSLIFGIGSLYSSFLVIKAEGKVLSKITFLSMLINVILVYPSISIFGIYGLAYQFVIVQFFQAVLQLKYNKEIFQGKL